jgi:apolipoprotein N-acyltransferase
MALQISDGGLFWLLRPLPNSATAVHSCLLDILPAGIIGTMIAAQYLSCLCWVRVSTADRMTICPVATTELHAGCTLSDHLSRALLLVTLCRLRPASLATM